MFFSGCNIPNGKEKTNENEIHFILISGTLAFWCNECKQNMKFTRTASIAIVKFVSRAIHGLHTCHTCTQLAKDTRARAELERVREGEGEKKKK